jgi:hypothetical protein
VFFCCFNKFVDHGGRRGNVAQALAGWRHLVASHEALDVLHQASYRRIHMVIEMASVRLVFFVLSILLLATTIS